MWLRWRHVGGGGGWWRPRHRMKFPPLAVPLVLILIMMTLAEGAMGIDCFKCVSVNGDNPSCEDPFNNNYTVGMLESPCMAGRKGREGLFPASACIKLAGIYDDNGQTLIIRDCTVDSGLSHWTQSWPGCLTVGHLSSRADETGESIMIRSCALDSGGLTTDTEIVRMSHCGAFYLEDKYVKGCLQSCDDHEGCNGAPPPTTGAPSRVLGGLLFVLFSHKL
ncbi:uncharacterized protein LOC135208435 [Macrobrachium nipponense]|uniref:uncharacterized protein LOC135208435 n=1 Tax=Macrobrachium nipponense TaxID=159736 RepID=UPI0030C813C1